MANSNTYMHASILRFLTKVAELGSIRRAADALNISSTAMNRKILNVERGLGISLFKRSSKGVVPTSAGLLLIRHARETLTDYQRIIDEIAGQGGELTGEIKIIGIGSMIELILPDVIIELAKEHKGLSFHVVDADPDEVIKELSSGNFDIGVTFLDSRHKGFEVCSRLDTSVGALMKSDHPLAHRKSVTLSECSEFATSMFAERWIIKPLVDSEFNLTGASFEPRLVTNSMALMQVSIRSGLGIGFFTPIGFIDDIRDGDIVHVPLKRGESAFAGIGLFAVKGMLTSPSVKFVLDRISDLFAELQVKLDSLN